MIDFLILAKISSLGKASRISRHPSTPRTKLQITCLILEHFPISQNKNTKNVLNMFCFANLPTYSSYLDRTPPPPLFSREVPPGSWFNNGTSVRRAPRGAKPTEPLQGKRPATGCKGVDGWNSSGWCFFSTPF